MATYKPVTAFTKAKQYVKNMPLRTVQVPILLQVSNMMWMAAPWRWTLSALPVVPLTSNTQDYGIPLPADFLFATDAYLSDGDNQTDTLLVEPALPPDVKIVGRPKRIAISGNPGENGILRTSTKTGTLAASPPSIISLYKKTPPSLDESTMSTAGQLIFPDVWSWVFEEGVLWQAYQWADDSRAGGAQVDSNGRAQYSGQRGSFEAALSQMREREKLPEPETIAKPETRKTRG